MRRETLPLAFHLYDGYSLRTSDAAQLATIGPSGSFDTMGSSLEKQKELT